MFHRITDLAVEPGMRLRVRFANGVTRLYDASPLPDRLPAFSALRKPEVFSMASVDVGGYGITWNDEVDLSSNELWEHGTPC